MRNLTRIINENEEYNYKPMKDVYFRIDESHFRINKTFNNLINNYENCNLKKIECDSKLKPNLEKFFNTYIFYK